MADKLVAYPYQKNEEEVFIKYCRENSENNALLSYFISHHRNAEAISLYDSIDFISPLMDKVIGNIRLVLPGIVRRALDQEGNRNKVVVESPRVMSQVLNEGIVSEDVIISTLGDQMISGGEKSQSESPVFKKPENRRISGTPFIRPPMTPGSAERKFVGRVSPSPRRSSGGLFQQGVGGKTPVRARYGSGETPGSGSRPRHETPVRNRGGDVEMMDVETPGSGSGASRAITTPASGTAESRNDAATPANGTSETRYDATTANGYSAKRSVATPVGLGSASGIANPASGSGVRRDVVTHSSVVGARQEVALPASGSAIRPASDVETPASGSRSMHANAAETRANAAKSPASGSGLETPVSRVQGFGQEIFGSGSKLHELSAEKGVSAGVTIRGASSGTPAVGGRSIAGGQMSMPVESTTRATSPPKQMDTSKRALPVPAAHKPAKLKSQSPFGPTNAGDAPRAKALESKSPFSIAKSLVNPKPPTSSSTGIFI
jgi:hypothetical protein